MSHTTWTLERKNGLDLGVCDFERGKTTKSASQWNKTVSQTSNLITLVIKDIYLKNSF